MRNPWHGGRFSTVLMIAILALAGKVFAAPPQCSDGIDNDGDGFVDFPDDLGCTSPTDNAEGGLPTGTIKNGWTVFEPSADTRIVYVSAAGNDAWDGLAPAFVSGTRGPKQTIAAGRALLRNGYPDWLLLRRGNTFTGNLGGWNTSGRSSTEPVLIAAYGSSTARPMITGGGWSPATITPAVSHVSLVGIGFQGTGNNDQAFSGLTGNDILIEDCLARNFSGSVSFDGNANSQHFQDVRIRRSVFDTSQNNMLFFSGVQNLLIEENVLANAAVAQNHAMYITRGGNSNVVTRGNLVHFAGVLRGNAIMQRPGGLSEGNVVAGAFWSAITMGMCSDAGGPPCFPPVPVTIRGNLATEGVPGQGQGGIDNDPTYTLSGAVIEDNMIVHCATGPNSALSVGGDNAIIRRNIVYDGTASVTKGSNQTWDGNYFSSSQPKSLIFADNLIADAPGFHAVNDRFFSTTSPSTWFMIGNAKSFSTWQSYTGETGIAGPIAFPNPTVTIGSYNQSLGGANDRAAFFAEAAKQSRLNWRPAYTAPAVIAYFRAGFGTAGGPVGIMQNSPASPALHRSDLIRVPYLRQYLQMEKDLLVYNLAGHRLDPSRLCRDRVYLVGKAGSQARQKMIVIK